MHVQRLRTFSVEGFQRSYITASGQRQLKKWLEELGGTEESGLPAPLEHPLGPVREAPGGSIDGTPLSPGDEEALPREKKRTPAGAPPRAELRVSQSERGQLEETSRRSKREDGWRTTFGGCWPTCRAPHRIPPDHRHLIVGRVFSLRAGSLGEDGTCEEEEEAASAAGPLGSEPGFSCPASRLASSGQSQEEEEEEEGSPGCPRRDNSGGYKRFYYDQLSETTYGSGGRISAGEERQEERSETWEEARGAASSDPYQGCSREEGYEEKEEEEERPAKKEEGNGRRWSERELRRVPDRKLRRLLRVGLRGGRLFQLRPKEDGAPSEKKGHAEARLSLKNARRTCHGEVGPDLEDRCLPKRRRRSDTGGQDNHLLRHRRQASTEPDEPPAQGATYVSSRAGFTPCRGAGQPWRLAGLAVHLAAPGRHRRQLARRPATWS